MYGFLSQLSIVDKILNNNIFIKKYNQMISFVIPSYNNLKHLKNVYSSLKRNEPDAEIIIIDDASTDGTSEWVKFVQNILKIKNFYIYNSRVMATI
jgi:glycosyltransferase involved in cell wall biosynthesis